ncbi:uncharacterized protein KIAA1257 homolog isoform X2 [Choloepus didactylus]|uniref:uncharacterized protein KIAA1257 homolog isoform X2 n=1 Tax=Choloepus didactylus TaxID=27675 RepID=UPI00189C99D5|nr:uncharacterized protein KIAA1257 homolog isoform X2 [Choloepus didactylus]
MSLQASDWEDEDRLSVGPLSSIASIYQSTSECDVEEFLKARATAQESETDSNYECSGSLHSSNGPSSTFHADVPQVVPCKFIISLAIPENVGHKGKYTTLIEKYKKHPKMEKPSAKFRRFYHIEYFFLPDDREPKRVDLVVFPAVAKVFLESGIKTVKPWHEDDKVWVSWTQTFNISVTKELLKKMNFHKITLRLWDSKEKVSRKVRYYRLKPSCHLDDIHSFEEVRYLVLNQRRLSDDVKANNIREVGSQEYPPGKQEKAETYSKSLQEPETSPKNSEENEKSLKVDDFGTVRRSISRGTNVSLGGVTMMEIKELIERSSVSSLTNMLEKQKSQSKGRDLEVKRRSQKRRKKSRLEEESDPKLGGQWKQGIFSIQLAVMPLLAGCQSVVSHGSERSVNILDCFLTLKTEGPIMNEEQRQQLNPLTIRIKCASCLPSQPVPFHELERLCMPVYCRYQFLDTPVHETEGQAHGSHIYFQDINVILLGAMHPSDLREYLEGPPMVVEVHDRDRKSEEYSRKPTLFGEDPLDSCINLQALISPRQTENNPFETQTKTWDPYGVARVSFAELLLGHTYLNLFVPIHNCKPNPTGHAHDTRSRKVVGFRVPTDSLQHGPMPVGNYLQANSVLKLRVDIAVPLRAGAEAPGRDLGGSQFGRIIFMFDAKKAFLLHSLLQDVTTINAKALKLDCYPLRNIQQILSAFKMRVKVQEQRDLDVLTGFHLLDGKIHLFILEGLADQGLRQLWESHQSQIPKSECKKYKVLYNSQLLFRHRLYADLETILYHVHLFKPLSLLMKQAMLYVRNAVPQDAFQALIRLHCICQQSTKLRDVVTGDLLPTSAMIKCLSHEFGMPISQEELSDERLLALPPQPATNLEELRSRHSTLTSEIQAHKEKYLEWRNTVMSQSKKPNSPIQRNITEAYQVRKKTQKPMVKRIKISAPATEAVYNYSIQTLNSTELAKKELYREMAKEPRKRFTYSQEYLSAMVEPQDSEAEQKKAQEQSQQAWLTASRFQVLGTQSSLESNRHPKLPPISRIEELKEKWKENTLFANVLEPVLDRKSWGWAQRHVDFDLYKKPPTFLELPPLPALKPVTGRKILERSSPVS